MQIKPRQFLVPRKEYYLVVLTDLEWKQLIAKTIQEPNITKKKDRIWDVKNSFDMSKVSLNFNQ